MLMDPAVMCIIYVYCILNQDQIVSFWFGTQFKARYLPWVLFGMNFILGSGGMSELAGIIVGHLYYFVMMKYPEEQGVQLLQTPSFLHTYFPSDLNTVRPNPQRPASTAARPAAGAAGATAPTRQDFGHNWGRGRRLED
ncbi:Derlin-1, partial [Fragariocoptes setiger]